MTGTEGLLSAGALFGRYTAIRFPRVQRDYAMGSGGEKLQALLTALKDRYQKNLPFSFSAIMGYVDREKNILYVYDGQQRLVTLQLLIRLLGGPETEKDLGNLEFIGRELANCWLREPERIDSAAVIDFTTYSMAQLRQAIPLKGVNNKPMGVDEQRKFAKYLLENVNFYLVEVQEVSEAEQLFMDLNDGLKLMPYEIFKAGLYHQAASVLERDTFRRFALKMENQYLEFFSRWKQENCCEEEWLVFLLRYCIRMLWVEDHGNDQAEPLRSLEWLEQRHLEQLERILDAMMHQESRSEEQDLRCDTYGLYWNLTSHNRHWSKYEAFLKNLNREHQTKKDVIVWCHMNWDIGQNANADPAASMRFIKKLLNHQRAYNQYRAMNNLWFHYYTKGVPAYYFEHLPALYYLDSKPQEPMDEDALPYLDGVVYWSAQIREYGIAGAAERIRNDETIPAILRERAEKEWIKLQLPPEEQKTLQDLENLPWINGLADNYMDYEAGQIRYGAEILQQIFHPNGNQLKKEYPSLERWLVKAHRQIWFGGKGKMMSVAVQFAPPTWYDIFTNEAGSLFEPMNGESAFWINAKTAYSEPFVGKWILDGTPPDTTSNGVYKFVRYNTDQNSNWESRMLDGDMVFPNKTQEGHYRESNKDTGCRLQFYFNGKDFSKNFMWPTQVRTEDGVITVYWPYYCNSGDPCNHIRRSYNWLYQAVKNNWASNLSTKYVELEYNEDPEGICLFSEREKAGYCILSPGYIWRNRGRS